MTIAQDEENDRSSSTGQESPQHLRGVARGGALNLAGAVIWGASNFALLAILTRTLGAEDAGIVILGIAVFNILTASAGLGSTSGLVRHISGYRTSGQTAWIRPTVRVAMIPVVVVSTAMAIALWALAPYLADLFGASGSTAPQVATTLRWMSPLLPVASTYTVLLQGTRGFDTMRPVVLIDKIGRGLLLPPLALVAAWAGIQPAGIATLWAATTLVALVPAGISMRRLSRSSERSGPSSSPPSNRELASVYWRFTAPRGVGQVSEVLVNWMDTVIVGAMIGTTAAGIYGAGTRYVLPGLFISDAVIQVIAPKVSGLIQSGRTGPAGHLVRVATGWQSMLMWPFYLLVGVFAPVLLRLFGPEVVAATGALRFLAAGVTLAALAGPAAAIILMSGRSTLAMLNTLVLVAINLAGNLVLVPPYGLSGAGFVWAVTLVVAAWLPAAEARRTLDVTSWGRPGLIAAASSTVTVLPVSILACVAFGQSWTGVLIGGIGGFLLYALLVRRCSHILELGVLRESVRPGRRGRG